MCWQRNVSAGFAFIHSCTIATKSVWKYNYTPNWIVNRQWRPINQSNQSIYVNFVERVRNVEKWYSIFRCEFRKFRNIYSWKMNALTSAPAQIHSKCKIIRTNGEIIFIVSPEPFCDVMTKWKLTNWIPLIRMFVVTYQQCVLCSKLNSFRFMKHETTLNQLFAHCLLLSAAIGWKCVQCSVKHFSVGNSKTLSSESGCCRCICFLHLSNSI